MLDTSKRRITLLLIFLFKPLDILIFYDLKYTVVVIGGEINLFLFKCRKVISSLCNNTLHDWLKKLGPFFHPIRVKLKPVVTRFASVTFISSFDWSNGLSRSFLIGQSDNFCFGFTTHTI